MGDDPPDKCATTPDVQMTAIGQNGLRINFEAVSNFESSVSLEVVAPCASRLSKLTVTLLSRIAYFAIAAHY